MKLVSIVGAGMLVGGLAGCLTTDTQPSATVTTLVPDVQRWFKVEWTTAPERDSDSERRLSGYVQSAVKEPVNKVQLLAQALDGSGHVVAQRLEWVPETIPAFGRQYFDIPHMPPAPEYRVTVWAFDRIKGGGGM